MIYKNLWIVAISLLSLGVGTLINGCSSANENSAQARSGDRNSRSRGNPITAVDVAIARVGNLQKPLEYPGTTAPFKIVSLRSQVEGRLLGLSVDVGDRVRNNQVIGQIDDAILRAELNKEEAELAAQESEVSRAIAQVRNAQAQVEEKRLELRQAQIEERRQRRLSKEGAVATQTAEQADTSARTALQALKAAQQDVKTQQEGVTVAKGRAIAQQAIVNQARERRSFSRLVSPLNGVITERIVEPGNLLQPGGEVVKIADFSRVKVLVQVSELELSKISVGQSVRVKLDAFPNQTYVGRVARISPAANARLIPVEVVISNGNGRIGSGLLGRVSFTGSQSPRIVIPKKAIENQARKGGRGGRGRRVKDSNVNRDSMKKAETKPSETKTSETKTSETKPSKNQPSNINNASNGTSSSNPQIFIIKDGGDKPTVTRRTITLGKSNNGYVEVLSGLKAGERFVVNSGSKPLKDGDVVRISIISETE